MEHKTNRRVWPTKYLGTGLVAGVAALARADDEDVRTTTNASTPDRSAQPNTTQEDAAENSEQVAEERPENADGDEGNAAANGDREVAAAKDDPELLRNRKWTLNNGVSMRGKKVCFATTCFEFTRVRGVVKLNRRALDDYPAEFQKIVQSVVSDAQEKEIRNNADLRRWVISNGDAVIPIVCVLIQCENGKRYPIPFAMLSPEDSEALWPEFERWADKEQAERDRNLENLRKDLETRQKTKERRDEHRQRMQELEMMRRNYALQNELLRRQLLWHIGPPYGPPYGPPPHHPPIYVIQPAPRSRSESSSRSDPPRPVQQKSESWGWKNGPDQSWGWKNGPDQSWGW